MCQAMRQHHFLYYVPGGMWSAAVEIPVRWLCLCEYDRLQDSYVGDWLPFQVSVRLDRSIYDGPCSLIYKPPSTPLAHPFVSPSSKRQSRAYTGDMARVVYVAFALLAVCILSLIGFLTAAHGQHRMNRGLNPLLFVLRCNAMRDERPRREHQR